MTQPCRVVILGAGPAGLGAAYRLADRRCAAVTVVEQQETVGGLAGGFELAGLPVDYGSHRLHPSCAPAILADIRRFLGDNLLDRPRHGRIRLRGRWIHFPLKPLDLLHSLPPTFALGVAYDLIKKAWHFGGRSQHPDSFASVLERGLGATICRDFYFPYASKIWGREPADLSPIQARRRVQAGSLGKMVLKILGAVPGLRPRGGGRFYYPRGGFGRIVCGYYEAARARGAEFLLGATVRTLHLRNQGSLEVEYSDAAGVKRVAAEHVWSSVPITVLTRCLRPQAPAEVLQACDRIEYRSMMLIYLLLDQERFSEFDAHYFPETDVPITRLSEPKNYAAATEPAGRTVLCAELPCGKGDPYWDMPDAQLAEVVQAALAQVGLPITASVLKVATRRLPQAYPIYQRDYEVDFSSIDHWIDGLPGILTLGRQGLFAHDNTHHTLAMAYAAVECLNERGEFDRARWHQCQKDFETHVVED